MGTTPDRAPGPSIEEETRYEDRTVDGNPTINGAVRYVGGDLVVKLSSGIKSLTAGAGALPPATQLGQVLYSHDGASFTVELPLTSCNGWLVNDAGAHLIVGD